MSKQYGSSSSDDWLQDLENNLNKSAVQPVPANNSVFNQINDIMNGGEISKFNTVTDVVEDMKARSGLTAYLSKTSLTNDEEDKIVTAGSEEQFVNQYPQIENTINNIISSTKGQLSVPAIVDKAKSIHLHDVGDDRFWEDDRLIIYISNANLVEKSNSPVSESGYSSLGRIETNFDDGNEPWNTDAFYGVEEL